MGTRNQVRVHGEEHGLFTHETHACKERVTMKGTIPDTTEVIRRFNDAFQRHEPKALVGLVAEECVLENTTPAPNGSRHVGREACLAVWEPLAKSTDTSFDVENVVVQDDRALILWRYRWGRGDENSVRGVNLMRVTNGKIVEALGYVKSGS
jgi:ketosteroid isomerase-like protein